MSRRARQRILLISKSLLNAFYEPSPTQIEVHERFCNPGLDPFFPIRDNGFYFRRVIVRVRSNGGSFAFRTRRYVGAHHDLERIERALCGHDLFPSLDFVTTFLPS